MGKKRVHELAKELGLDNKEVLDKLQAAGLDVKSHSSSVYEDEARAVLGKPKVAEPPPAAAVGPRRPGMMIVKRKKDAEGEEASATGAPEGAPVEAAGDQAESTGDAEPQSDSVPAEMAEAEPSEGAAPEGLPPAQEARPTVPMTGAGGRALAPSRPGAAQVVRMIDRDKLMERVPSRRLGGGAGGGAPREGAGAAGQRFGQVTELKVVTDPFGRGREMVNLAGRDKKGKPGPTTKVAKKERPPTKREMMEMRERSMYPSRLKKKKPMKRSAKKPELTERKASKRVIKMKETMVVSELAHQLGVKATDIIGKLMSLGTMVTQNQSINFETAQLIAADYEYTVESVAYDEAEAIVANEQDEAAENQKTRPPVVTVMGHVDHGKTSLLDAIRKAKVAAGEAGGITQHIGAYSVEVAGKGSITFLDTPGHAAFTSMRARGAQITDLVVLVVAADDGVMPQTEEAIKHAQAAEVPIIVAVNKIDKPEAQPDRVMQELTKFGLQSEAWGGDTMFVNTSATKGTGIPELLEAILLQSEVLELTANPERQAIGVVVEAQLDKGRGPVATILVQQGTLKRGDSIVAGEFAGKVRAMADASGRSLNEAPPSAAVEITGLEGVPEAGDTLHAVDSAEKSRELAAHRAAQKRAVESGGPRVAMSLDDIMKKMETTDQLDLKVVLKADVQGSVQAVREALQNLTTEEVKVTVVLAGVGGIKESDIMLAAASKGLVIGFGVKPDANTRTIAEREGVEIRSYNIIYEALDEVHKAMEGLLAPETKEKVIGHAEVREVFRITKVGQVAGCRVMDGKAARNAKIRVMRDNKKVFEGKVSTLKQFKNDAREIEAGQECGVAVEGYSEIKVGDVLEFFQVEEVARTLSAPSSSGGKRPTGGGATAHA
jgi:translation initiation factor IF-2